MRFDTGRGELRFEAGRDESSLWATGCVRVCWVSELRFWLWAESSDWKGDVWTVCRVKIVSLSPRVKKLKVKKKS